MAGNIETRLIALRKDRGVSQDTVAESCGISRITLARYENGTRTPVIDIAAKLADYYGVTVDYILGRDDIAEAPQMRANYGPRTMNVIVEVLNKLDQLAAYEDGGVEEISNYADYLLAQRKKGET